MRIRRSYHQRRGLLQRFLAGFCGLALCLCVPAGSGQTSTSLLLPAALAYDAAGNLYIADANRHQVFEATLAGALLVVAGTGTQGFAGDGGPATVAQLNSPQGLAFGSDGTLYIADSGNARVRSVSGGTITTFAGTGAHGYSGDGGTAIAATFRLPTALGMDHAGALLICDSADQRIRRVAGGFITTFAGDGVQGLLGDGAPATAAEFDTPAALAIAPNGRVFVADSHNQRVRVIDGSGTISTFVGSGARGFAGDGGAAKAAELSAPRGLTLLPDGTLLVADTDNGRVRAINPSGLISTVAGASIEGSGADGTPALAAPLRSPRALATSSFGMPAVTDTLNRTVRVLTGGGALYQPAALASTRISSLTAPGASGLTYGTAAAALQVIAPVGVAQGSVALLEGGQTIASGPLIEGAVSLDLSGANAGTHTLTAIYAGDGLNPAATLPIGSVTIAPAVVSASMVPVSAEYGAPLPPLAGVISGVLPGDASGVSASFNVPAGTALNVGTYSIAVTLTGPRSGNYALAAGQQVGTLTITQAASRVSIASGAAGFAGVPTLLSANVFSTTAGQPTGTVQFLNGTNVVAAAPLVNGSASAMYTVAAPGSWSLSARYAGDANFAISAALPQAATMNPLPDFGLALTGAATASVNAGTAATFPLTVSSSSGSFTGVVTLSVAGMPAGATATFSPVQVVPGSSSATVVATVLVPALAMERSNPAFTGRELALAGVLCGVLVMRRRKLRLVPLLCLCTFLAGCGARTVGEASQAVTKVYPLQITGTSTNLMGAVVAHGVAVTLTVQN